MVNHSNLLGGLDLLCFVWSDLAVAAVRDIAVGFIRFFSRLADQTTWQMLNPCRHAVVRTLLRDNGIVGCVRDGA